MSSLVSEALRQQVAERAEFLCEYCLLLEDDGFFAFEVDHIISRKHGGRTELSNLAFACPICNRFKGSDLGTISRHTGVLTRFFNPRIDAWQEHFKLNGAMIESLSEIGEGTRESRCRDQQLPFCNPVSMVEIQNATSIAALARATA